MIEYTSYERVKASLEHREPDRIPFDLGGTMVSGINVKALAELKKYLGLPGEARVKDWITQMAETDEEVIGYLKVDVKNVSPNPGTGGEIKELGIHDGYICIEDEWGMRWKMPLKNGHYYDLYHSPLATASSTADIDKFPWPNAYDPARYKGMKNRADEIVYKEKKAYVLGRMSSGMWEHAMWMRGYEQFFIDMMVNPVMVEAIMERILEVKMQYWERALDEVGENVLTNERI